MMLLGQLLMDSPLVSLLALTTRSVEIFGAHFGMFFLCCRSTDTCENNEAPRCF